MLLLTQPLPQECGSFTSQSASLVKSDSSSSANPREIGETATATATSLLQHRTMEPMTWKQTRRPMSTTRRKQNRGKQQARETVLQRIRKCSYRLMVMHSV